MVLCPSDHCMEYTHRMITMRIRIGAALQLDAHFKESTWRYMVDCDSEIATLEHMNHKKFSALVFIDSLFASVQMNIF